VFFLDGFANPRALSAMARGHSIIYFIYADVQWEFGSTPVRFLTVMPAYCVPSIGQLDIFSNDPKGSFGNMNPHNTQPMINHSSGTGEHI
jgi:hypothetical protein